MLPCCAVLSSNQQRSGARRQDESPTAPAPRLPTWLGGAPAARGVEDLAEAALKQRVLAQPILRCVLQQAATGPATAPHDFIFFGNACCKQSSRLLTHNLQLKHCSRWHWTPKLLLPPHLPDHEPVVGHHQQEVWEEGRESQGQHATAAAVCVCYRVVCAAIVGLQRHSARVSLAGGEAATCRKAPRSAPSAARIE